MNLNRIKSLLRAPQTYQIQICGFKHFPAPPNYDDIKIPERQKLTIMEKVPTYAPGLRPPKMQKRLRYMRGPELVHNKLIYRQYGIIALGGGRLKSNNFDMIRLRIGREMDTSRMFAIWRVDPPWQPVTKLGQGQRLGGGKGAIDHYVTPIKAGRVILEIGGKCEYTEVKNLLETLAKHMPFKAQAVSQEILDKMKVKEKEDERQNVNPFTMKYIIQNNMGACHTWLSPFDLKWFCKYT